MKKLFLFILTLSSLSVSQDSSWWENIKSYEEKLKKISEDFQKEYNRAKYLEEVKEQRQKREKKLSPEYQRKALEEVVRFLRDEVGNKKSAEFIEKMYKEGNILWGEEDSSSFGKVTLDMNHLLEIYDKDLNINYPGLLKLTSTIIHESIHCGQWGAYFKMTSNANEEEAYFGTLSSISNWIQEMEKKIKDQNTKDPCIKKQRSENLKSLLELLFYYDSIIYEKSDEVREKIRQRIEKDNLELQTLYEMKSKARKNLDLIDIYQKNIEEGLKRINLSKEEKNYLFESYKKTKEARVKWQEHYKRIGEKIKLREERIKIYEAQLNEPQLDITKFKWVDESGNIFNRDKLLKYAREKQKNLLEMEGNFIKECEKKLAEEKIKKPPDLSKLPKEEVKNKKEEILSCLCRCQIPAGVWGGYFPDPLPNTSPSCEKPGICAAGNWGCYRFYPPLEGACFESCIKLAGGDGKDLRKEILNSIQKDFDALIKAARKIMEDYLKKPGMSSGSVKRAELFAYNFVEYISDFKGLYDLKIENSYLEKVKEKNKRGDPDRVLSLIKEAEKIKKDYPYINSGELTNLRAEFAIILSKAALNILPEMEFDEGIFMLDKALSFYGENKDVKVKEIADLKMNFLKWKDTWNVIKNETPLCLDFLKNKKICACQDLYKKKLEPSFNLLDIYIFPSRDKWKIFDTSGTPVKISPKEKIYNELKESMERAKKECENNPVLNTKEFRELKNYYAYKTYESSIYTDKENLRKYAATPICDSNALKIAEKILSNLELCDCQRKEIEEIFKIAKGDARPMKIFFDVKPGEVKLKERAVIELKIDGGKPPYNVLLRGSFNLNKKNDPSPGFVYNWIPDKPGIHYFDLTVQDLCGEIIQKKISVIVRDLEVKKSEKIDGVAEKMKEKDSKDETFSKPTEEKASQKKTEEKGLDREKENLKEKDKKISSSLMDLNGKWIVNCGDEDIEALIVHKGEKMEIKIEDSYYRGNITGNKINLKTKDKMEEISGNIINENEIKIKVTDKNFPQSPGNCYLKRAGKIQKEKGDKSSNYIKKLEVVFENRSSSNIHIFVEGQDSFGPHNRIAPGERRSTTVNLPEKISEIKFIAGRNGQKISECKWQYDYNSNSRYPVVVYDESNPYNRLSCKTALK